MLRKIFADTGYWIALLNPDDALHQKARSLTISLNNLAIVSSEMVFTELLNAFSSSAFSTVKSFQNNQTASPTSAYSLSPKIASASQ